MTGLTHTRRIPLVAYHGYSHWELAKFFDRLTHAPWASRKAEEGAFVQTTTSMFMCVLPVIQDLERLPTLGAGGADSPLEDAHPS